MNPSRIEKAIDEIYEYVENCKPSKLYPNKVTVSKDELYDLLDALRMCAPEEIKRYQKIINNREEILSQAQAQAEQIMNQAVNESEQVRTSALYYTSDLLGQAGRNIETSLKELESKSTMLISALKRDIEVIKGNRAELKDQIEGKLPEDETAAESGSDQEADGK